MLGDVNHNTHKISGRSKLPKLILNDWIAGYHHRVIIWPSIICGRPFRPNLQLTMSVATGGPHRSGLNMVRPALTISLICLCKKKALILCGYKCTEESITHFGKECSKNLRWCCRCHNHFFQDNEWNILTMSIPFFFFFFWQRLPVSILLYLLT